MLHILNLRADLRRYCLSSMSSLPTPTTEELAHSDNLQTLIRAEITARGPMAFSRYMELALYAPGFGYYSAGKTKFGAAGDFITAPEIGNIFARCLAHGVAPLLREFGVNAVFLELGGGSGAFARDVLLALANLDVLPQRYLMLEPSADLRERQYACLNKSLPKALSQRVHWIERPPQQDWQGVVFANEVLDALPATRFVIRADEVFEEVVISDAAGDLRIDVQQANTAIAAAVRCIERSLGVPFANGYRSEILPQLPYWIAAVLGSLRQGLALFVDYGYARREYYSPERHDGTLICHYRHRAHADALFLPGLQDITAFVDFTALAEAGDAAGFDLAGYSSQAQFVLANGLPEILMQSVSMSIVDSMRVANEIKRLTLPGEMGERFQVMGLQRGLGNAAALFVGDRLRHRL